MGMLYRRKKKDLVTGKLVEAGPWWMKYYDQGKPYFQSTGKFEKREAKAVLHKAEVKVLEGQREGNVVIALERSGPALNHGKQDVEDDATGEQSRAEDQCHRSNDSDQSAPTVAGTDSGRAVAGRTSGIGP